MNRAVPPAASTCLYDLAGTVLIAAADNYFSALAGEALCDCAADAGCAAGDQRGLALKSHVFVSLR